MNYCKGIRYSQYYLILKWKTGTNLNISGLLYYKKHQYLIYADNIAIVFRRESELKKSEKIEETDAEDRSVRQTISKRKKVSIID